MDFTIQADHKVKIKESEYIIKYLDLVKEMNMRVTVMPIVIRALGTTFKDLEKRLSEMKIRERIKSIQTISLSKLARILRSVLKI